MQAHAVEAGGAENTERDAFDMAGAEVMIGKVHEAADLAGTPELQLQGRAVECAARESLGDEVGDAERGRAKLEAFAERTSHKVQAAPQRLIAQRPEQHPKSPE